MGTLSDLFVRGSVILSNGAKKMRELQVRLLADEVRGDLEHIEPYGFSSEPLDDQKPEAFTLFFGGDKSHGVVFCVADRRYRLTNMKPGEVVLYDDLGQKIHFTRDGLLINTPKTLTATVGSECSVEAGGTTTVKAPSVTIDSPTVSITGDLLVSGKVQSPSVISNGIAFNTHCHTDVERGPNKTGGPV